MLNERWKPINESSNAGDDCVYFSYNLSNIVNCFITHPLLASNAENALKFNESMYIFFKTCLFESSGQSLQCISNAPNAIAFLVSYQRHTFVWEIVNIIIYVSSNNNTTLHLALYVNLKNFIRLKYNTPK